jgi:CHAD domain-containing protein
LAFQCKRGEAVPRAIRRIVTEQLDFAAEQLHTRTPSARGVAVHEARKSIKKVRAVLRLMSNELGDVAEAGNTLLRDLARNLSAQRDAAVLVDTFDSLKDHLHDPKPLAQFRTRLVRDRTQASRAPFPGAVAFALERVSERVRTWPLHTTGFAALAPGLGKAFHRARKAMVCARKNPTPQTLHEWRKRVKDHWYHMRLLEGVWTEPTRTYEKGLKDLETCLGDDHNLAVLRDRVAALGTGQEQTGLFPAIDHRQKQLRERALQVGARLYAQKPGDFIHHVEQLWDAAQPKSKKTRAPAA